MGLFDPIFAGEFVSATFSLSIIRESILRVEDAGTVEGIISEDDNNSDNA
jgi:hypothetical protein